MRIPHIKYTLVIVVLLVSSARAEWDHSKMVTQENEGRSVHDLLLSVSPPRARAAAAEVDSCELALMETDDEKD